MKTKKSKLLLTILFTAGAFLLLNSCNKSFDNLSASKTNVLNMTVSPDFKFSTTELVKLEIASLDNIGDPVQGIRFDVYTDNPQNGGSLIMSGVTDVNGELSAALKLPAGTDSLAVVTNSIGFMNFQKVGITGRTASCVFGGKQVASGFKSLDERSTKGLITQNPLYHLLGDYNSLGVPVNLEKDDIIDAVMISDINSVLPEKISLNKTHPEYFLDTNQPDVLLNDAAKLWVTFVHEGAGYSNTLAFYKFKVGKAPTTASEIDTLFVIFPNVSFNGSGGGLVSGNKVYIGAFPKGTGIGFALIANGWNGKSLGKGLATYYSDRNLNPEKELSLRNHSMLLLDIGRGKFLLSFEDMNRNTGAGNDDDFNDAIFYVTADPLKSIDVSQIPVPEFTVKDSDEDGISDVFDNYPSDPAKAFNNYYPSKGNVGTLAFEDSWPASGDYDLNDMVLDYNFNQVTNSKNQVVSIVASVVVKALGANYHNGFGIQLPVSSDLIQGVKGNDVRKSLTGENPNGTEAGQSKATIIFFDDAFNVLPYPGDAIGVNTTMGAKYVTPDTIRVNMDLLKPLDFSDLGVPPYNAFITIDGDRKREEHLIDNEPTELADPSLFRTGSDDSDPKSGRYYVTPQNMPFAIDIAGPFDYPVEKIAIAKAHLKFSEWAQSGGKLFVDWYNPLKGYRATENIYTH